MQSTKTGSQADVPETVHQTLINIFHANLREVIEVDLVNNLAEPIQQDGNAFAIRPRELIKAFVIARQRFQHRLARSPAADSASIEPGSNEYIPETAILLLFASEHILATNTRKRYLQDRILPSSLSPIDNNASTAVLRAELCLLDSFLTSPLPKHTKSTNLWNHRLWIFKTFGDLPLEASGMSKVNEQWPPLFGDELKVVLKAGDRHFANYVAFDYGRQIYRLLAQQVESAWLHKVTRWCLAHPRDISGWSFLDFLVRQEEVSTLLRNDVDNICQKFVVDTATWNQPIAWFAKARGWPNTREGMIRD